MCTELRPQATPPRTHPLGPRRRRSQAHCTLLRPRPCHKQRNAPRAPLVRLRTVPRARPHAWSYGVGPARPCAARRPATRAAAARSTLPERAPCSSHTPATHRPPRCACSTFPPANSPGRPSVVPHRPLSSSKRATMRRPPYTYELCDSGGQRKRVLHRVVKVAHGQHNADEQQRALTVPPARFFVLLSAYKTTADVRVAHSHRRIGPPRPAPRLLELKRRVDSAQRPR